MSERERREKRYGYRKNSRERKQKMSERREKVWI